MEYRYAEGSAERLPDLAAELVRLQVDVLVAGGTTAIRAAQHATRTIPIVMTAALIRWRKGSSPAWRARGEHHGLELPGRSSPASGWNSSRRRCPRARASPCCGIRWSSYASRQSLLHNLTAAARALGLHLHVVEVRRADELDTAFAAMPQARADALLVMEDALVFSTRLGRRLADLAATGRLPAMYSWREYVEAGGLMAYGPSLQEIYRRAATYVDKILKGAKPADLPVEQPTKFELVINLKTAKALGITMPPSLLLLADEVIQ